MVKSKKVGSIIYDYMVLEKLISNKRSQYKIKCNICGNEKLTYNLNESSMTHSNESCKETYCKSFLDLSFGDFKVVKSYYKNRLLLDLKCNICGEMREGVPQRDMSRIANKHGIYCVLNSKKYDKKLINKICRTYCNCKTRIQKGNEGDIKYKGYKDKDFGFVNSLDMVYELYDNLLSMNKIYPLNKLTIDRTNNELGYVHGNVSYITLEKQAVNKSTSKIYFVDDKTFESSIDLSNFLGTYQQHISRLFGEGDWFYYNGKFIKRIDRYSPQYRQWRKDYIGDRLQIIITGGNK